MAIITALFDPRGREKRPLTCLWGGGAEVQNMGLMTGKKGVVFGVANEYSLAWFIARWVNSPCGEPDPPRGRRAGRRGDGGDDPG